MKKSSIFDIDIDNYNPVESKKAQLLEYIESLTEVFQARDQEADQENVDIVRLIQELVAHDVEPLTSLKSPRKDMKKF